MPASALEEAKLNALRERIRDSIYPSPEQIDELEKLAREAGYNAGFLRGHEAGYAEAVEAFE